jgi:cell wall-associated NlpC family hydrolase
MNGRLAAVTGAAVLGLASTCGAGVALIGGATAACTGSVDATRPGLHTPRGDWTAEQVDNAAAIVDIGVTMDVPARGWTIAVATAMQESSLTNLPGGDRDSVGLFQQRPSQGWGTPQQLSDPVYAAGKFYQRLLTVPDWQSMQLTDAAQAVQSSATPTAYAAWEPDATTMVAAIAAQTQPADLVDTAQCPSSCPGILTSQPPSPRPTAEVCDSRALAAVPSDVILPPGTPPAVATAIGWALQQLGTPYSYGGDCTAADSGDPAHQCDCSSLVQMAYRAAGISLPRTAAEQSRIGTLVASPDQLQPGDLLFVPGSDGTPERPGHVGIYLGDRLVLDAPHAGASVHLTQMTPYWTTNLAARRIITTG